jgi:hypothetical protein
MFRVLVVILLFISCKKNISEEVSLWQVIANTSGNYVGTKVSYYYQSGSPVHYYDTILNYTLVVTSNSDSSIHVNNTELEYYGDYSNLYKFIKPIGTHGHEFQITHGFDSVYYGFSAGGLGGGGGWIFHGMK